MKRLTLYSVLLSALFMAFACNPEEPKIADFEDMEGVSIYNFVLENDSLYGNFLQILDTTGVGMIISAYNPYNTGYTLFLPNDQAVNDYIEKSSKHATLDDLLGDTEYVTALAKYHVVNLGIDANDFPFGALPAQTLSRDLLTVSFVLGEDSAYYSINNQAPVTSKNNELSNGFVHVISKMLLPITFTTQDWLMENDGFEIFKEVAELTGFTEILDRNLKEDSLTSAITLLVEPDTVFNKKGIYTLQDLLDTLEVTDTDYTSEYNGLYQFVGYHILDANAFLDDFFDEGTNFTTFGNLPVNVNGKGKEIEINRQRRNYDTIVVAGDTTIIDYIGINYDASNVITQSGAVHLITQVMTIEKPTRAIVTFEFWEEPLITQFREEPGEYIIEDPAALRYITWTGPDLLFVEESDTEHPAWGDDYLKINGDFSITYTVPKIVQGDYEVHLRGHAFSELNALVEVFIDGKKVGGLIDFAEGGSENNPYHDFHIADIEFSSYERHDVEIRSLIPGVFEWDYVRFEPITD